MNLPNEDLTREERESITRLPREAVPPPALEEATVRALSARGLLRRAPRHRRAGPRRLQGRLVTWGLVAAAASLVFAAGYLTGQRGGASPPAELPRFLLLLYEGPEYQQSPPGQESDRVREYGEWAARRGARGELEAGEKLRENPDIVIAPDGSVASVPPSPRERRLAGFFLIRAADGRSALEIARSCPHVRYGGSIVIREIEPT